MSKPVILTVDDLRALSLFDGLTESQLAELIDGGTEVAVQPGVELFREGEHSDYWWVLLEGSIELTRHIGQERTLVGRMMPGLWAGGFRAWDEHGVYLATGVGATHGRVLRVPADVLRDRFSAWFPFGRHLIEGLYGTARTIESTARQRQSLVTLGRLAAGLAHEINNPAAAASRAADDLDTTSQALVSSLAWLASEEISAQQFTALDELRQALDPRAAVDDPLALSDREEELSSWLSRHGIEREWLIAPALAAANADLAWCERAAAVLPGPALEPALEWVASTLSAATLLAELKQSTRRISELIAAVKSYSQMDRSSMQRIDVTSGIESTLTMLAHKLRDGVTVVRRYGADVPEIEAHGGELNQVWTNLIDNAIDAMDGAGTLTITTTAEGDSVGVEIADTGPGMPAEVAARAFEAFYTTKDVGKGTGLGLDIARRIIVERHSGTIAIDSRPGETVLRVRIPVRPRTALCRGTGFTRSDQIRVDDHVREIAASLRVEYAPAGDELQPAVAM
jgi:signal transduction histidine kinase